LRVVSIQKLFFYEAQACQCGKPLKKCIKKTCPQDLQNVKYTSCLGIQQSHKKAFVVMWWWENQQKFYFFAKVSLKGLSPPNR